MGFQDAAKTAGNFGGKYLGKLFGFFFIFLFIAIPLLYAITISVQANSFEPGLNYIAPKLIAPVQALDTQSLLAIEQEGVYVKTGHFFRDIWAFVTFYWLLLGSLYMIYKWHSILYKIMPVTPYSNNSSAKMTNIILAITVFLVIQMLFLGGIAAADPDLGYWDALTTPYVAGWHFIQAFPFFITEANALVDWNGVNGTNISSTLNETLNYTINNATNDTIIDSSQGSIIIY